MKKNDLTLLHKIIKQVKTAKQLSVRVGVPESAGTYTKTRESVSNVGLIHEFGIGVQKRSFLKAPFYIKRAKLKKSVKNSFKAILKGGDATSNLKKVGATALSISRKSFKTNGYNQWSPLKDSTVNAKGSSKILIDTGKLAKSLKYWVVK